MKRPATFSREETKMGITKLSADILDTMHSIVDESQGSRFIVSVDDTETENDLNFKFILRNHYLRFSHFNPANDPYLPLAAVYEITPKLLQAIY